MFINPLNRKYSTIRKFVDRILSPEQDQHRRYGSKSSTSSSSSSLRSGTSSSSIQSSSSAGSFGSFSSYGRRK